MIKVACLFLVKNLIKSQVMATIKQMEYGTFIDVIIITESIRNQTSKQRKIDCQLFVILFVGPITSKYFSYPDDDIKKKVLPKVIDTLNNGYCNKSCVVLRSSSIEPAMNLGPYSQLGLMLNLDFGLQDFP